MLVNPGNHDIVIADRDSTVCQDSSLNAFIKYCKVAQPDKDEYIERFFRGVVCFPYDNELLLQAYLFLNIQQFFPSCKELLLFEKPPYGGYTNKGKCDFVYLTDDHRLLLIETKYIDLQAHGGTRRKRRNKHRNKVFDQVLSLKQIFCQHWKLHEESVNCAVFTTDSQLSERGQQSQVNAQFVSIPDLIEWQQELKPSIL